MLEQQDDRGHWDLRAEGRYNACIDAGLPDVLETARDRLQDRNRVVPLGILTRVRIQIRREREDDEDKCVAQDGHEEEHAFAMRGTLGRIDEGILDGIER